jgi:hypothetical protein
MEKPEHLKIAEGYARLQLESEPALEEREAVRAQGIAYCREKRIQRLLVNGLQTAGIDVPSVIDRYWAMQEWGERSEWSVSVAVVMPQEHIDPEKVGVLFAENAKCKVDAFTSEPEALKWLLTQN